MKTKIDDKCNNPTAIIVTEKIKINYNLSTSIIITNFHFHKEFYLKQAIYCIIYEKILSLNNSSPKNIINAETNSRHKMARSVTQCLSLRRECGLR